MTDCMTERFSSSALPGNRSTSLVWIYRSRFKAAGSTIMRGYQLKELAKQHLSDNVQVSYEDESAIDTVKHSIVILTKNFLVKASAAELLLLKENGNVVCADYVDEEVREDISTFIDVYIASSISQYLHYSKKYPHRLLHLITHAADSRINGIRGPADYCNIGYFGEIVNVAYRQELQGRIDFCLTDTRFADNDISWINRLRHCNVHYAVRNQRPVKGFKPFLKGFTAAQCHSNIIVPLDESDARYYLGSEYPYILKDASLKSVLWMIEWVKESLGGPEWRRGLEIMTSVRERCSPAHIIGEIKGLLNSCCRAI